MEAQKLYIKITRLSLKSASNLSKRRIQELNSGIGELRQLLSCAVCCQLLNDPYKPKDKRCGHHVCRLCLRGRKRLLPSCAQCNDCCDFKTYEENKSMAMQLLCYKTLCVHLLQSSLYAQLYQLQPDTETSYHIERRPRIRLPNRPTQWFIQEGANYEDMCDTFLSQPELPFLGHMPPSLPAETPPTTAATTPELPYEQHMPDQLSLTDIELEAAVTGEQAQYAHPLPMMTPGARILTHSHIAPQPQMLIPAEQTLLPAGYIESRWSDQVDLSGALSLPTYSNSPTYTTYVMPSNELHMPSIGQVVQLPQQMAATTTTAFEPVAVGGASSKRRHAQLLLEDVPEEQLEQQMESSEPVVTSQTDTRMNLRNHKATIISSVQVKPPTATSSPIVTAAPVAAAHIANVPAAVVNVAAAAPPPAVAAPVVVAAAPVAVAPVAAAPTPVVAVVPVAKSTRAATLVAKATTAAAPVTAPVVAAAPVAAKATVSAFPVTSTPVKARGPPATGKFQKAKPKDTRMSHICRCGTTSAPGRATCRNSRCTCYVAGKSCVDCKCIGCKNPHQDAPDTSDEEDSNLEAPTQTVAEEPTPVAAAAEEPTPSAPEAAAAGTAGMQSGFTLVPLDNLQQTQHPLVLMQNENGQYQGFNIFNGTEPVDPAQLGFQRVPLRSNDGNTSIPEFAYVMPPPAVVEPTLESQSTPSPTEQPAKKFKGVESTELDADCGSSIKTAAELVSAVNAAAGDSLGADKEHAMFEYFLNEDDDDLYNYCTTIYSFYVYIAQVFYPGTTRFAIKPQSTHIL
ncbi:E3 ubiquitin-protein ligase msl-2 [Drosophila novamexicana]|uniref:E3 ubiquitin-protein ligase msl-2 n=1 Tax=Drosophila novamexicana TaxID=47314 RepID=UPI0011E5A2A0|nr:E3 ubiquitin-protein ligase msl-2 [Drosophila novamexicana]XP_030556607.1 E3 ubiquitin-protein ligase msl-2 [Drosophila novamexicana]